jgi:hypothetical protein
VAKLSNSSEVGISYPKLQKTNPKERSSLQTSSTTAEGLGVAVRHLSPN